MIGLGMAEKRGLLFMLFFFYIIVMVIHHHLAPINNQIDITKASAPVFFVHKAKTF